MNSESNPVQPTMKQENKLKFSAKIIILVLLAIIFLILIIAFVKTYKQNYKELVTQAESTRRVEGAEFLKLEFMEENGTISLVKTTLIHVDRLGEVAKPANGYLTTLAQKGEKVYETYMNKAYTPLSVIIPKVEGSTLEVKDLTGQNTLLSIFSEDLAKNLEKTPAPGEQTEKNISKQAFDITLRNFLNLNFKPMKQTDLMEQIDLTRPTTQEADAQLEKLNSMLPIETEFMHVDYDQTVNRFVVFIYKSPFEEGKMQAISWFSDHGLSDPCALNLEFRTEIDGETPLLTPEEKSAPGCTPALL